MHDHTTDTGAPRPHQHVTTALYGGSVLHIFTLTALSGTITAQPLLTATAIMGLGVTSATYLTVATFRHDHLVRSMEPLWPALKNGWKARTLLSLLFGTVAAGLTAASIYTDQAREAHLNALPQLAPETVYAPAPTYQDRYCKDQKSGTRMAVVHKDREYLLTCK